MLDHPEEEQAAADRTVGSKVNAIIEAAEEAAKEIRDRANLEAIDVLRQAEQHAAVRIEELTREAAQAKTEADQYARDMTEAADSYGTQHRRTVEEEARRLLAESEAKAKETLAAAQEKAEELESTVVQRHETLQREAKMLEERKQRVLESLRDLAAQIQDALVEPVEQAPAGRGARGRPRSRTSPLTLELDHVLIAVADLEAAARELEARHGLTSIEGGRHPGVRHGQPDRAARRDVPGADRSRRRGRSGAEPGRTLDHRCATRAAAWLVPTHRPARGRRPTARPDDRRRLAGHSGRPALARANRRYRTGRRRAVAPLLHRAGSKARRFPAHAAASHRSRPSSRSQGSKLSGDADRLADWLGPHDLPITICPRGGGPRASSSRAMQARSWSTGSRREPSCDASA